MTTVVFTPRVIDITEHVPAYAPPEVIVLVDPDVEYANRVVVKGGDDVFVFVFLTKPLDIDEWKKFVISDRLIVNITPCDLTGVDLHAFISRRMEFVERHYLSRRVDER